MDAAESQNREVLWGYAKRLRFVRHAIRDSLPKSKPQAIRVLEVGCGNGSQLALPLARQGFQVTGVDIDEPSIENARRLAAELDNAEFVCGVVEQLPRSELFDVIILSEVLEHTSEPESLLASGVSYMSADGIAIVTVPNGFGEFEVDSWFFRTLRLQRVIDALVAIKRRGSPTGAAHAASEKVEGGTNNEESPHIQFFTRRRLKRIFSNCGLMLFREGAASLWAGPLVGHTLARSNRFIEWNARITDNLPLVLASGWYFALSRQRADREIIEAKRE